MELIYQNQFTGKLTEKHQNIVKKQIAEYIEEGGNINLHDAQGNTLLMYYIPIYLIRYLIDQGASVDEPNNNGSTPLLIAIKRYEDHRAQLLKAQPPLHIKIMSQPPSTIHIASSVLLTKRANILATNDQKETIFSFQNEQPTIFLLTNAFRQTIAQLKDTIIKYKNLFSSNFDSLNNLFNKQYNITHIPQTTYSK